MPHDRRCTIGDYNLRKQTVSNEEGCKSCSAPTPHADSGGTAESVVVEADYMSSRLGGPGRQLETAFDRLAMSLPDSSGRPQSPASRVVQFLDSSDRTKLELSPLRREAAHPYYYRPFHISAVQFTIAETGSADVAGLYGYDQITGADTTVADEHDGDVPAELEDQEDEQSAPVSHGDDTEEEEDFCRCVNFHVHGVEGADVACALSRNPDGTVASACVAALETAPKKAERSTWRIRVVDNDGNPSGLVSLSVEKKQPSVAADRFVFVWDLRGTVQCGESVRVRIAPRMPDDFPPSFTYFEFEREGVEAYHREIQRGPQSQETGECWIIGELDGQECGRHRIVVTKPPAPPPPPPAPPPPPGSASQIPDEPGTGELIERIADGIRRLFCTATVDQANLKSEYGVGFWWSTPRRAIIPNTFHWCNREKTSRRRLSWDMNEGLLWMTWNFLLNPTRTLRNRQVFLRVTYRAEPVFTYPAPNAPNSHLANPSKSQAEAFLRRVRPDKPRLAPHEHLGAPTTVHRYFSVSCVLQDVRLNFIVAEVRNSRAWDHRSKEFVPSGHGTKYHDFVLSTVSNYSLVGREARPVWNRVSKVIEEDVRGCTVEIVP